MVAIAPAVKAQTNWQMDRAIALSDFDGGQHWLRWADDLGLGAASHSG